MLKVIGAIITAAVVFSFIPSVAFCDIPQDEVIAIANTAIVENGITVGEDVNVIYDEGGKLWSERVGYLADEDTSPNHGILRQGFLKNYKVVLYDFKEPLKDVWVFVDKDTGDVLTVYQEE